MLTGLKDNTAIQLAQADTAPSWSPQVRIEQAENRLDLAMVADLKYGALQEVDEQIRRCVCHLLHRTCVAPASDPLYALWSQALRPAAAVLSHSPPHSCIRATNGRRGPNG